MPIWRDCSTAVWSSEGKRLFAMKKPMAKFMGNRESAMAIVLNRFFINGFLYPNAESYRVHFGLSIWKFVRFYNFVVEVFKNKGHFPFKEINDIKIFVVVRIKEFADLFGYVTNLNLFTW